MTLLDSVERITAEINFSELCDLCTIIELNRSKTEQTELNNDTV